MNILILTTHANTGGITSYILTLGEGLVKAGHKVVVVTAGGNCVDLMSKAGMRHVKLNIRTKSEVHPKLWLSLGPLCGLIRKENIDVIHAQTRVTQVLGTVLSRLTGVSLVTTCHGFFRPRWFRKTFPCWGRAVIAISKPVAEHLSKDFGVAQDKIHWIANGIDLERFVMRQNKDVGDVPLIGIIARLSDVKGIDILIKAMPLVLKKIPCAQLMIVGQGPQEDGLKKLTQEMGLTGQISFKDTVIQTSEILCSFDVFVMPSLMEGLGLSVMEAQACGIPVVASKVGGLVDLIEDGKSGYLVESKNTKALAQRIIDVLDNRQQAEVMAQQARLNIERHFSARAMVAKTAQVYEQYSGR